MASAGTLRAKRWKMWEKESRGAEVLFRRLCNTRNPLDYDSLGRSGLALNDRVSTCTVLSAAETNQEKLAAMTPIERKGLLELRAERAATVKWGRLNHTIICPQCHTKGAVRMRWEMRKGGVSGGKGNCDNLDGRDLFTATRALPMARGDWGALRQLHLNVVVLMEQATTPRKAAWQPIGRAVNPEAAIRENWSQRLSQC